MAVEPNSQEWINELLERVDLLEQAVQVLEHQVYELQNAGVADHCHHEYAFANYIGHPDHLIRSYD